MKHKTHSGLKKRAKVRGTGTVMMQKSCKNHRLTSKSRRQKNSCQQGMPVDKTNQKKVKQLLNK